MRPMIESLESREMFSIAAHAAPHPAPAIHKAAVHAPVIHKTAIHKPAIQKLASFAKSGATIPWVRVYSVTSGVNWSHRKHLDAGMKCQMCHGDVAQMSTMSEATSVLAMGVCITCHEAHKAPVVCSTCHSWPSH